jgi:hypothetical protein
MHKYSGTNVKVCLVGASPTQPNNSTREASSASPPSPLRFSTRQHTAFAIRLIFNTITPKSSPHRLESPIIALKGFETAPDPIYRVVLLFDFIFTFRNHPAHSPASNPSQQQWPAERASLREARAPAARRLASTAPRNSKATPRALVSRYVASLPSALSCFLSSLHLQKISVSRYASLFISTTSGFLPSQKP